MPEYGPSETIAELRFRCGQYQDRLDDLQMRLNNIERVGKDLVHELKSRRPRHPEDSEEYELTAELMFETGQLRDGVWDLDLEKVLEYLGERYRYTENPWLIKSQVDTVWVRFQAEQTKHSNLWDHLKG